MRLAVSRFIECISRAQVSLTEKTKRSLLDTLNENLKHPNSHIQVLLLLNYNFSLNFYAPLYDLLLMLVECCC